MKRILIMIIIAGLLFNASLAAQPKPLSIDECIALALEHNPDIIRGEFTYKISEKDITSAIANFLPSVSASMGYYHSVVGPSSATRIDPQTGLERPIQPFEIESWASSAGVTANQSIFDGGYSIYNYKRARNIKEGEYHNLQNTKQTITLAVTERYYNLLKAEKSLDVAKETLKSSEESLKRAEAMYEVGKAPKSDVMTVKVQTARIRLSLIEAHNNLAIARASLNHILGLDVDYEIDVVDNLEVPEIEVSYEDALLNSMSEHPALIREEYNLDAAKAGVGMALAQYVPSLSAFARYDWRNEEFSQIKNIFDTDYNWYMGVQLSIPIFQGFARTANYSKAQLQRKASHELLKQTKRNISLEVKEASFSVDQAKSKIAVTKDAITAAEENLRLHREKYNLGAGTMLDLINAQVSYAESQSEHIQSLYDYKYAIARLRKAMGSLGR